jgi:hypothetical protein
MVLNAGGPGAGHRRAYTDRQKEHANYYSPFSEIHQQFNVTAANTLIRRRRKSCKDNLQVGGYNELRNVIS